MKKPLKKDRNFGNSLSQKENIMLTALPTAQEMNLWDAKAEELGLPAFTLMENAARAAWQVLHQYYRSPKKYPEKSKPYKKYKEFAKELTRELTSKRIALFAGSGNNGGDAFALARMLHDEGLCVRVFHTKALEKLKGICAQHAKLALACGVSFSPVSDWLDLSSSLHPFWTTPDISIDGLLGTGFSGNLSKDIAKIINEINTRAAINRAFVLSLDVPSGLCAKSGLCGNESKNDVSQAIKATATVTFQAAKPGIVLPQARPYVGELHTVPIGLPKCIMENFPASHALLDESILRYQPKDIAHKGQAGHVLIVGGSKGLCGAALLAAQGALSAGAGKVTLAMPAGLFTSLALPPDIMSLPLSAKNWEEAVPELLEFFPLVDSLVLGMGIGRSEDSQRALARILQEKSRPPSLIDADALYAIGENPSLFEHLRQNDILSPHPGEAAQLLNSTNKAVQADRFTSLASLQALSPQNPVWILKGAGTLVGQDGQHEQNKEADQLGQLKQLEQTGQRKSQPHCFISPFDIEQLAVAGSGDVLAGTVGTFLAQGLPPLYAAALGVYRHCLAGLCLAKKTTFRGNSASDIAQVMKDSFASGGKRG